MHVHQASQCHVSAEDLSHLAYSNVNEQRIKQQQRKATRNGNFKLQIVNILWNICVSSQAQSESWRDNNKKVIEAIIAPYRSLARSLCVSTLRKKREIWFSKHISWKGSS